jgi:chromosome segregation ATPase
MADTLNLNPLQPGSDAYEVVPGSQLIVARTAHRNNSSKYTINDRTSNFSEVTTLLKSRGIDLDHKRFLILQVSDRVYRFYPRQTQKLTFPVYH